MTGKNTYSKKVIELEAILNLEGLNKFETDLGRAEAQAKKFGSIIKKSEKESSAASLQLEKDALGGTKAVHKSTTAREKQAMATENLTKRDRLYSRIGKELGTNQAQTNKVLGAAGLRMQNNATITNMAGKEQRNYMGQLRNNISVNNRFNMSQLGIMFAGMALNKAMAGLNSTSREWLGIGTLMSDMMGITLLGSNMDLLQFGVLPLFNALTSLPDGIQKAIGVTILALEGLGATMMVGGQLALGLDSAFNLLTKFSGVPSELIFTSKGLGEIQKKLGPIMTNVNKFASYAAAGITITMAIQDLVEGDITAAVGDAFMAAGFLKGGKAGGALFIVGISLKLIGEDMFASAIAKAGITMMDTFGQIFEWISDNFNRAITGGKIDWGAFGDIMEEFDKVAAEKVLSGDKVSRSLAETVDKLGGAYEILRKQYVDELEDINNKHVEGSDAWSDAISELDGEYKILLDHQKESIELQKEAIELNKTFTGFAPNVAEAPPSLSSIFSAASQIGVAGLLPRLGGGNSGENNAVITINNNINVSDPREIEAAIKKGNESVTNEIMRTIKVGG